MGWKDSVPGCVVERCGSAVSFGEALYFGLIELLRFEAGSKSLSPAEARELHQWLWANRLSLATFQGVDVSKLSLRRKVCVQAR